MRDLKEMKEYLKKKWQTVYNTHKKMNELKKVVTQPDKSAVPEKFTIPYIPNDIGKDDEVRNM